MSRKTDPLVVLMFRTAWWCGSHLPLKLVRWVFAGIAKVLFVLSGSGVKRLQFNVARMLNVEPTSALARATTKRAHANYFRYWAEMFGLAQVSADELQERVKVRGLEYAEAALADGGVLFVATHSGNWDWVGAWAGMKFGKVLTVAERLEPVEVFDAFVAARQPRGIHIIPHRGSAVSPVELLAEQLQAGGVAALVVDRDLSRSGVEVQLHGHLSKMPAGPQRLVELTGCAVVPLSVWYDGDQIGLEFYPRVDAGDPALLMQRIAAVFDSFLSQRTTSWFMLQQVWLDHPVEWGGRPR